MEDAGGGGERRSQVGRATSGAAARTAP